VPSTWAPARAAFSDIVFGSTHVPLGDADALADSAKVMPHPIAKTENSAQHRRKNIALPLRAANSTTIPKALEAPYRTSAKKHEAQAFFIAADRLS
jgi:hypothetical protein